MSNNQSKQKITITTQWTMQPTIHIQHYPEKHAFNLSQSPCHLASSMQRLHHVERSRYRSRCHWLAHRGENPVVPPVPQAAGRRCRFFDVFATQKGPSTLLRLPTMYDICFIEILQLYIYIYKLSIYRLYLLFIIPDLLPLCDVTKATAAG